MQTDTTSLPLRHLLENMRTGNLHNRLCRSLAGVSALLPFICGCAEPEQIRTYTVAKPTQLAPSGDAASERSGEKVPTRMLAAMIDEGQSSWFFKMMGDPMAVGNASADFRTLIVQVEFQNEEPVLQAPESWQRRDGNSIRFATFAIPAEPKDLELSVIRLPKQPQLANVNRWRGQVGLAPLDDLKDVGELETKSGMALFVDLTGVAEAGGPRMPPFAGGMGGAMAPPRMTNPPKAGPIGPPAMGPPVAGPAEPNPAKPGPAEAPNDPFLFSAPDHWTRAANDQFSKLAFTHKSARITATPMGAAALEMNLTRWRNQLGLPPVDKAQLMEETSDLETKAGPATYVRYFAPGEGEDRQAILGAVLPVEMEGRLVAWFLKLKGTAKAAEAEEKNFKDFIQSIEF